MLILDVPRSPDGDGMIRIGVIGSCRVRDLFFDAYKLDPPPSESLDAPACKLAWYRFSAFTHTPSQALQYYNFVTGACELPEAVQPCVLCDHVTDQTRARLATLTPELIDSIELFVTEIGTLKELRTDDHFINISYTEVNLVRAGGKPLLRWWRNVFKPDEPHELVVRQTLDALPSRDLPDTEGIRQLIRQARTCTHTKVELQASIARLADTLRKPLMVVPPFDVPGATLVARAQLIDHLHSLSRSMGFHFFDPTSVVAAAGRETALAGNGADVNHYAPDFHFTLLKAVVPFLQQAVAEHAASGAFSASRYLPERLGPDPDPDPEPTPEPDPGADPQPDPGPASGQDDSVSRARAA